MRATITTFAGLVALTTITAQAAPLPPTKSTMSELGSAPPVELVREAADPAGIGTTGATAGAIGTGAIACGTGDLAPAGRTSGGSTSCSGSGDARASSPVSVLEATRAAQSDRIRARGQRGGPPAVRPRAVPTAGDRSDPNGKTVAQAQPQCRADGRSWVRREVCDPRYWGDGLRPLSLDRYRIRRD